MEDTYADAESAANGAQRTKCTPEETAEGTALVEEILKRWQLRADEELDSAPPSATQDSTAGGDGEGDVTPAQAERAKQELELLKEVMLEFKPRLEASPWATTVLLETY